MKVSYWRLSFVVFLIVVWHLFWLASPNNLGSRESIDGISWECGQLLHQLTDKDRAECIIEINKMKGCCQ